MQVRVLLAVLADFQPITFMEVTMAARKLRPVLVLDTHRGIYFGYLVSESNNGKTVKLKSMRHCFSFSIPGADMGVYGLATHGPEVGSRIGPRVNAKVHDVSKIVECSDSAVKLWENSSW